MKKLFTFLLLSCLFVNVYSQKNDKNIVEYTNLNLTYISNTLNNNMFLNLDDMLSYSAEAVMADSNIGSLAFMYSYAGGNILLSPNAYYIEYLYSINGLVYENSNKNCTKFEISNIMWENISSDDFTPITIPSYAFPDTSLGYGVSDIDTNDIFKFQTEDSIIGFIKVNYLGKYLGDLNINVKIISNNNISDELENNSLSVYPNPTSDFININSNNSNKIQNLEILNLNGQVIYSEKYIDKQNVQINISNFEKGIYIVKVFTEGKTILSKIVKY